MWWFSKRLNDIDSFRITLKYSAPHVTGIENPIKKKGERMMEAIIDCYQGAYGLTIRIDTKSREWIECLKSNIDEKNI